MSIPVTFEIVSVRLGRLCNERYCIQCCCSVVVLHRRSVRLNPVHKIRSDQGQVMIEGQENTEVFQSWFRLVLSSLDRLIVVAVSSVCFCVCVCVLGQLGEGRLRSVNCPELITFYLRTHSRSHEAGPAHCAFQRATVKSSLCCDPSLAFVVLRTSTFCPDDRIVR